VTANKALLAAHGPALLDRAVAAGVDVAFEASVGGGIPIIRTLREAFASDWVTSLVGIVNGTCNFVLTRMREGGLSFDQALTEAQEKGYAEADPELDVGGHDAAHKLVVLAMLAFGARVDASSVPTEGIRDLEAADHAFADRFGYAIKHLAIGRDAGGELELRVHPALVRKDSAIANVNGVLNAIALEGRALGPCLLSGRGAGAMPTAVSVVADVLDVARAVRSGVQGLMTRGIQMQARPVRKLEALRSRYYLRFAVADEAPVLGAIATHLGRAGVTVEQMVQTDGSLVMTTHPAGEHDLDGALELLEAEHLVLRPPRRLRIVEL
jgi:homoserine dehydrogenase